jgi:rhodanese-related sulfurtransferase
MPLTLIGETPEDVEQARRELVRIGIDRPAAAVLGVAAQWPTEKPLATIKIATFADVEPARSRRDIVVLDVRRNLEWNAGHVANAVHIPLHELLSRIDDVPDAEVWVHCAAGYRASIAASMLAAAGRDVVLVDDDYDNAANSGVRLDETTREIR